MGNQVIAGHWPAPTHRVIGIAIMTILLLIIIIIFNKSNITIIIIIIIINITNFTAIHISV